MTAIPLNIRRQVWERSGYVCECGCGRVASHIHHRKLRSQGGRHELPNLLHLSDVCHTAAHANPTLSYVMGLLVHSWDDPADVPILMDGAA